jgi:hypothetical protein
MITIYTYVYDMFTILGLFEGTKERWERVGKKNERD